MEGPDILLRTIFAMVPSLSLAAPTMLTVFVGNVIVLSAPAFTTGATFGVLLPLS